MKITSSHDSVERLKELTSNNMKNIEGEEHSYLAPLFVRKPFKVIDKNDLKDLGFGSVTLSGLTADFVINKAQQNHYEGLTIDYQKSTTLDEPLDTVRLKNFLMIPSSNTSERGFFISDGKKRIELLEGSLKILKNIADYVDNNSGEKTEEAKAFLKEELTKVGEEIKLLNDAIQLSVKRMPHSINDALIMGNSLEGEALKINNSTLKDNGMIELGNSIEETPLKIKNSTFSDSFGDM